MLATHVPIPALFHCPPSPNTTPSPPSSPSALSPHTHTSPLPSDSHPLSTPDPVNRPPLTALHSSAACATRCDQCDLSLAADFPACFLRKVVGVKRGREDGDVGAEMGLLSGRGTKRVEIEVEAHVSGGGGGGRRMAVAVAVAVAAELGRTEVASTGEAARVETGTRAVCGVSTLSVLNAMGMGSGGGAWGDGVAYWPSELCW